MAFTNIGFGNYINTTKIISMITPDSAPAKRIVSVAKESGTIVDATQGRRTRCVIICDDNVVLSALMPETIVNRINENIPKEAEENDS